METNDIQAIILKGYSKLSAASYVMLQIEDSWKAKKWLNELANRITPGSESPEIEAINISITYKGLEKLNVPQDLMNQFPIELEDGMITPHKTQFLGDFGSSHYNNWDWGNNTTNELHLILMLYAINNEKLDAVYNREKLLFNQSGLIEIHKTDSNPLVKDKEHFGFRDGVAQPTIAGMKRKDVPANTIAVGEFVLGYKNEHQQYTRRPIVNSSHKNSNLLPKNEEDSNYSDLGKNGSYMVYRQLQQDVSSFWHYMDQASRQEPDVPNEKEMIRLASKMMGRWPSGAPLTLSPDEDNESLSDSDNFGYRKNDMDGSRCPFASHVRRSNPRDTFVENSNKLSIILTKKHRILRRGRSYGPPLSESLEPKLLLEQKPDNVNRGLHFICFNADIARQFEFIQNVWVNNPKFANLHDERDPITGNHSNPIDVTNTGSFSIPKDKLKERYIGIPEFIKVIGGAYLFTPGIRALHFLSKLD